MKHEQKTTSKISTHLFFQNTKHKTTITSCFSRKQEQQSCIKLVKMLPWDNFRIQNTNHTSPERGQRLDSSGDVKDNDKDKHKDKYGEKDKDIHEESLPVFISLGTLSSNE